MEMILAMVDPSSTKPITQLYRSTNVNKLLNTMSLYSKDKHARFVMRLNKI